jgi:autotransporter-associated beta strand protein
VANVITGAGSVINSGTGPLILSGQNTYSGGATLSAHSTLQLGVDQVLNGAAIVSSAIGTGTLTFDGGKLQALAGVSEREIANAVQITANGGTIDSGEGFFRLTGNITDASGSSGGKLIFESIAASGIREVILSGNNTYSGITYIDSGAVVANSTTALSSNSAFQVNKGATLTLSGFSNTIASLADGVSGGGVVQNAAAGGTATLTISGAAGGTNSFSGVLQNGGIGGIPAIVEGPIKEEPEGNSVLALVKDGPSTQILAGINTYTGTTTINGGVLEVDGSIASSTMTTVNANSVLTGVGTVGNTTVASGGTLLPGNGIPGSSLSIAGNLAFQSGALYLVQLNPTTSTFTRVSGTATLNGLVGASFASGSYVSKQYVILTAAGGVTGTFSGLQTLGLPSGFAANLSYDAHDAYLNLVLGFSVPTGLNVNQQNVANALSNFFNATGGIPMVFGGLTPAGLTQVSGELATGSQQATFDAINLFMGLLSDPSLAGRGGSPASGAGASTGYTSTESTGAARDAFAMFTKAPPVTPFEQRWSVWGAGFGGSQTTDGNAALGSNNTTSSVFGTAVGADYRISPFTVAGFALAGGGTNFSVAGSGSGHSDLFQAGAFIRHTVGPAYISAALAYGWQDITTNRTVTVAGTDLLRAQFDANAFSGRLEGGYRFVAPWIGGIGITPYAAAQFTTFDLPAYAEQAIAGANAFALGYNAKDVTDTRSELGIRTDKSFAMTDGILTLRGRLAWAHDYDPDRSIAATFQTLPGASFVVNGAAQAADSALVTASIEKKWINGWSAAATFEGEFSDVTRSYAGKGVVRYQW